MKKHPRPPNSHRWDQFEKLTAENNELIEMLLKNKELKAIYSKVSSTSLILDLVSLTWRLSDKSHG